jgi:hypothetical protein
MCTDLPPEIEAGRPGLPFPADYGLMLNSMRLVWKV